MAEKVYIELDEIVDAINHRRDSAAASKDLRTMHELNCLLEVIQDRDCFPAADVAPVKHGKWIEYQILHYFKCSECKCTVPYAKAVLIDGKRKYNYCPSCGAKMDEES